MKSTGRQSAAGDTRQASACSVAGDDAVRIREARSTDLATLAELVRKETDLAQRLAGYFRITPGFDWIGFVRGKMGKDDRKLLLAENGARIIGFIEVGIKQYAAPVPSRSLLRFFLRRRAPRNPLPLEPLSWGVIEGIFVEASCRGRGTGRALVTACLVWFQQMGIRRIELGVLANNGEGRNFWQQSGFETYRLLMYRNLD